jgi:general stress protein 26
MVRKIRRSTLRLWGLPVGVLLLVLLYPMTTCSGQVQSSATLDRDSVIAAAREIMGMQKYCALITIDSLGYPQARTMNPFPPEADMTVWIATNSRSKKVREIRSNARVCLYYADHAHAMGFVALTGRATLVDDMKEKVKRKRDYWDQAFPDWKFLILIKVVPERLDVLNYRRGMLNDSITWRTPSIGF